MKKLLSILLLLICLQAKAQVIYSVVSVTNTPTNGATFTAQGVSFLWTNGTPVGNSMLITNTTAGDATNFYNTLIAALGSSFSPSIQMTNATNVTLGAPGIVTSASINLSWASITNYTNGSGVPSTNLIVPLGTVASSARAPMANQFIVDYLNTYATTLIQTNIPAMRNFVATNSIGGAVTLLTGGAYLSPVFTNGQNYGAPFRSPGLGTGSEQFGINASASTNLAVAFGDNTSAAGIQSTALGYNADALKNADIAVGSGAVAQGSFSIAMGYSSEADGTNSTTIGMRSNSQGNYSTSIGDFATAFGVSSSALGDSASALYNFSTAIGQSATTTTSNQIMLGTASEYVQFPGGALHVGTDTNFHGWATTLNGTNTLAGVNCFSLGIVTPVNGNNIIDPGTNTYILLNSGPSANFTNASIKGGIAGRILFIEYGGGFPLYYANESGFDTTAANRIDCPNGTDMAATNSLNVVQLIYNGSTSRWRVVSINGSFPGGGSSSSGSFIATSGGTGTNTTLFQPLFPNFNATLTTGVNSAVSLGTNNFLRIIGPSAAFSVAGIAGGNNGSWCLLENTTAQPMSILHDYFGATAGNKIYIPGGTTLTLVDQYTTAAFWYDVTSSHWILSGTFPGPHQYWNTTGNSGQLESASYVGNADTNALILKTGNVRVMRSYTGTAAFPNIVFGPNNSIASETTAGDSASIFGGDFNSVDATAGDSSVVGGSGNQILSGSQFSFIGGGGNNIAKQNYAFVAGGYNNVAANLSFAGGSYAFATNVGDFVWNGNNVASAVGFGSTSNYQFLVYANNGVAINTNNPGTNALRINGSVLIDTNLVVNGTITSTGGVALNYRAGQQAIGSLATSQAVTFTTPLSSASYSVSLTADGTLAGAVGFGVTTKATTGFTITLSAGIAGGVTLDYIVWPNQ